ncbi:MAG: hypothetical protein V3U39_11790 [Acidimicrobiia bacterium]
MTESGEHRRRYGDKEVGLILKRAAELQGQAPASAPGGGLSLHELEEIAAEAGINPGSLRRAAAELDEGKAAVHDGAAARFLGGPPTIRYERTLRGELSAEGLERLIVPIQRAAGKLRGQAGVLGRTLTWRYEANDYLRSLQVIVASRNGRTRIDIEERLPGLAWGIFGGIMGGGGLGLGLGVGLGVGIGALGSALFSIVFPVAALGGAYFISRPIFGSVVRRRQRVLRQLLDELTEEVEAATSAIESGPTQQQLPGT